jgi:uncharacterized protein (TIGR03435 family)
MRRLTLVIAIAALAIAQTRPEFEVASIRPSVQDEHHSSRWDNGHFTTHNLPLRHLVSLAYDIDARFVSGGPAWVDSESFGFDINAKIPDEFAHHMTPERQREILQSLLASRFQLAIHREAREIAGYELTLAKTGPKMRPSTAGDETSHLSATNAHLRAENVTMAGFAADFSHYRDVDKLIVDKTGLTGRYNFELDWAGDKATADGPSIFTALREQLGLKLEAAKVPILAVVIDRAERPESN